MDDHDWHVIFGPYTPISKHHQLEHVCLYVCM